MSADGTGSTIVHEMGPFAIVPLWLLDALVEAKAPEALRLYVALHRWTGEDRTCYPSRQKIAATVGVSTDTIDRYVKALTKVGALEVIARQSDDGDRTSNLYVLRSVRPGGRTDAATRGVTDAATGGRTDAAVTRSSVEADPVEADKNNTAPDFDAFWPAYVNAFGSKRVWVTRGSIKSMGEADENTTH